MNPRECCNFCAHRSTLQSEKGGAQSSGTCKANPPKRFRLQKACFAMGYDVIIQGSCGKGSHNTVVLYWQMTRVEDFGCFIVLVCQHNFVRPFLLSLYIFKPNNRLVYVALSARSITRFPGTAEASIQKKDYQNIVGGWTGRILLLTRITTSSLHEPRRLHMSW